jgi:hypothetical protein
MMWSKGFASEETKAAFSHAQELAAGSDDARERSSSYYGLWIGRLISGELGSARETAEAFRREAEKDGSATETAVACRILGLTYLWLGDFIGAQARASL